MSLRVILVGSAQQMPTVTTVATTAIEITRATVAINSAKTVLRRRCERRFRIEGPNPTGPIISSLMT
jgi:hypothetical protein